MARRHDDDLISEVRWERPPKSNRKYDWVAIAEQLKDKPMDWAMVFEKDKVSLVNAIRQGAIRALHPDLGFEVRTANNIRTTGARTCTLYLRFNPRKVLALHEVIEQARPKEED